MSAVNPNTSNVNPVIKQTFLDEHVTKVVFLVSTFVQFIFGAFSLILGGAAGVFYSMRMTPNLKLNPDEKIIDTMSAVFSVAGALATLIKLSPAGASGGILFQMVPYGSAFMVGTSVYRAYRSFVS